MLGCRIQHKLDGAHQIDWLQGLFTRIRVVMSSDITLILMATRHHVGLMPGDLPCCVESVAYGRRQKRSKLNQRLEHDLTIPMS